MKIHFFVEDVSFPKIKRKKIKESIVRIAKEENISLSSVNIVFCSDEYLLNINKEFLQHNYYTDIITFDYEEEHKSSDIFISVDRVLDNAQVLNIPFIDELHRVIFHGVLHLCGYDDHSPSDKALMTSKENKYLSFISGI